MTNTLLLIAATLNAALLIALLWQWRKLQEDLAELDCLQLRLGVQGTEILRLAESQQRIEEIQNLAEATVEGGTAAVRTVHKAIADIPFDLLEEIPATRDTSKLVRGIHDLTSDGVYGSISAVNKLLGKGSRLGLGVGKRREKDDTKK